MKHHRSGQTKQLRPARWKTDESERRFRALLKSAVRILRRAERRLRGSMPGRPRSRSERPVRAAEWPLASHAISSKLPKQASFSLSNGSQIRLLGHFDWI